MTTLKVKWIDNERVTKKCGIVATTMVNSVEFSRGLIVVDGSVDAFVFNQDCRVKLSWKHVLWCKIQISGQMAVVYSNSQYILDHPKKTIGYCQSQDRNEIFIHTSVMFNSKLYFFTHQIKFSHVSNIHHQFLLWLSSVPIWDINGRMEYAKCAIHDDNDNI